MRTILFFSFLMLGLSNANCAQIYTWTDENGETHFSQHPPTNKPNQKYEEKHIKTNRPAKHSVSETNKSTTAKATTKDKNILRKGETGPLDKLVAKKNPDKLYLVAVPNINEVIKKEEKRKGRKLTAKEIEKIRSTARVKAVEQHEIHKYQ